MDGKYIIVTRKQLNYLDKQIRCYDRKINGITLPIKKEKRSLSENERRQLKYYKGRRDECVKMKWHLIKLLKCEDLENTKGAGYNV